MHDNIFKTKTVLVIDTQQEVLKRTEMSLPLPNGRKLKHIYSIMSATSFITQRNFLYKSLCAFFVLHFQYTFYYDLSAGSLSVFRNSVRNTSPKLPRPMCFSTWSLLHSNCGISWTAEATMCFLPTSFGSQNGVDILQVISVKPKKEKGKNLALRNWHRYFGKSAVLMKRCRNTAAGWRQVKSSHRQPLIGGSSLF